MRDRIDVKIGVKGFKSYYLPIAQFLERDKEVKIAALGKRVQMAVYLSSILQKHGARIEEVKINTVQLPNTEALTNRAIDVVMIEIIITKNKFISQITELENKENGEKS